MSGYRKKWETIEAEAQKLGFCAFGVAPAAVVPDHIQQRYKLYLNSGFHYKMNYLEKWWDQRINPSDEKMLANASHVISVALSIGNGAVSEGFGQYVAAHARGRDYHRTLKRQLGKLALGIKGQFPSAVTRNFVDTAPVMERTWAVLAGIGKVGRSGALIVPGVGPKVLLGEIFCAQIPLENSPLVMMPSNNLSCEFELCQNCNLCVAACPTGAISMDGLVDATKCLSFHTIENQEHDLPNNVKPWIRTIFGCDICTSVCPHNHRKAPCLLEKPCNSEWKRWTLSQIAQASIDQLDQLIEGTCLKRTKAVTILRNAKLASENEKRMSD